MVVGGKACVAAILISLLIKWRECGGINSCSKDIERSNIVAKFQGSGVIVINYY